jgi:hypothetical protein
VAHNLFLLVKSVRNHGNPKSGGASFPPMGGLFGFGWPYCWYSCTGFGPACFGEGRRVVVFVSARFGWFHARPQQVSSVFGRFVAGENYSAPVVRYLLLPMLPLRSASSCGLVSYSNGRRRWSGSGERPWSALDGVTRIYFRVQKKFLSVIYMYMFAICSLQ